MESCFVNKNFKSADLQGSQRAIAMKLSGMKGIGAMIIAKQGCHYDIITSHVTTS